MADRYLSTVPIVQALSGEDRFLIAGVDRLLQISLSDFKENHLQSLSSDSFYLSQVYDSEETLFLFNESANYITFLKSCAVVLPPTPLTGKPYIFVNKENSKTVDIKEVENGETIISINGTGSIKTMYNSIEWTYWEN